MKNKMNDPRLKTGSGPAGGAAFRLAGFPKEFERNVWEELDKRYYIILVSCWIVIFSITTYLGNKEYPTDELSEQIRQKFIQKVYDIKLQQEPEPEVLEPTDGGSFGEEAEEPKEDTRAQRDEGQRAEARGQSIAEKRAQMRAEAAARGRARAEMAQSVATQGVLGIIGASGGGGTGDAVADVLGSAVGGTGDLDNVLAGVSGMAVASSGGQRTQIGSGGGRATGTADIGALSAGTIGGGGVSIGRRGSISMAIEDARVSGTGSKTANRSSDAITKIMNGHSDAIEFCYKKEARINPNLKGDLVLEFTIDYRGRVSAASIVSSSIQSKGLERCVLQNVRRWRFDPIDRKEGDVTVRNKYIFG